MFQLVNQAADYETYKPSDVSFLIFRLDISVAVCIGSRPARESLYATGSWGVNRQCTSIL
jgi:hypothetical protein